MENNNTHKKPTEESLKVQKSVIDRLSRVEGQIRGLKAMIEKGTYCDEIINQIEASRSALSSIAVVLLESHFKNCVVQQVKDGDDKAVEDLLKTVKKLIK